MKSACGLNRRAHSTPQATRSPAARLQGPDVHLTTSPDTYLEMGWKLCCLDTRSPESPSSWVLFPVETYKALAADPVGYTQPPKG